MKYIEERYEVRDMGHDTPCHLWLLAKNEKGYGIVKHEGRTRRAHIVHYEAEVGPVPEGHVLDHLCNIRHCIRSSHLEPVTQSENLRRMRDRDPEAAAARLARARELRWGRAA